VSDIKTQTKGKREMSQAQPMEKVYVDPYEDLRDTCGCQLVKGQYYKIASEHSSNRFKCVFVDDPNGTMFVRESDGMVFLGREFIKYRDGIPYWDVYGSSLCK